MGGSNDPPRVVGAWVSVTPGGGGSDYLRVVLGRVSRVGVGRSPVDAVGLLRAVFLGRLPSPLLRTAPSRWRSVKGRPSIE